MNAAEACKTIAAFDWQPLLEGADVALMVAGALVLLIVATVTLRRHRRFDLGLVTELFAGPTPEGLIIPVLLFYLVAGVLYQILGRSGPEAASQPGGAQPLSPTLAIVTTNCAMFVAAIAGYVVARRSIVRSGESVLLGHRPAGRQAVEGATGALIALAACGGVLFVTMKLIDWVDPGYAFPEHSAITALHDAAAPRWFPAFVWLGTALITPAAEELFFRGLLQSAIRKMVERRGLAIVLGAFIFSLAHLSQPQVVPAIFVFGLILGVLFERNGSLAAPIVAHGLFNAKTLLWESLLRSGG